MIFNARKPSAQATRSAFSMSRSLVSRVCSLFFLHRAFAFVVVLGFVALHRVSIRTLDELSRCKLGAGWGSRGESMLLFIGRSQKTKTRTQSSEHGVVATVADALLNAQPHATMIEVFVYWGGMNLLKTYQVEGVLTWQMYATDAKLGVNRAVDRMHAIMALTHCEVLVTDDKDLIRRCEAARKEIPFKVATVQRGQDFINFIEKR
jgi:hypothetical protein